jgi:small subunit ribosomal protein S16
LAVRIRLKRIGAKKQPRYRIVVADARSPRDGRFIEEIGYYNPLSDPAEVKIDEARAKQWLAQGAQPTNTVRNLFVRASIISVGAKGRG